MQQGIDVWLPPELASRYRFERVLGRGGMGVVALAKDLELGRRVAIKRLPPESCGMGLAERLVREAQALAKVSCPHVVRIFDAGTAAGHPYLVMEHLEGVSLAELLDHGLLNEDQLAVLMEHVLEGLASAHEAGILHRDVKPSNVLRLDSGRWVLIDFGLARRPQEAGRLTAPGAVVGTVFFLAPELVTGGDPSPQSDLFAAALTGYAAWTGTSPLGDTVLMEGDAVRALSSLASGTYYEEATRRLRDRGQLGDLLTKALSPQPHLRFASARAMLERLRTSPSQAKAVGRASGPSWPGASRGSPETAAARSQAGKLNPPTQPANPVFEEPPGARTAASHAPAGDRPRSAPLRRWALPADLTVLALTGALGWPVAHRPEARPVAPPGPGVASNQETARPLPVGPPPGPLGAAGPGSGGPAGAVPALARIPVKTAASVLVRFDPCLWLRDAFRRSPPGTPLSRLAKEVRQRLPRAEFDALGPGAIDLATSVRDPLQTEVYELLFSRFGLELMAGLPRLSESEVLPRFPDNLRPAAPRPSGRSFRIDLGKHPGLSTGRLLDWFVLEGAQRRSLPGDDRWKMTLAGASRSKSAWVGLRISKLEPSAYLTLSVNNRLKIGLMPAPGARTGWLSHTMPIWPLRDGENVFDAHLHSHVGARDTRLERLFESVVVLVP